MLLPRASTRLRVGSVFDFHQADGGAATLAALELGAQEVARRIGTALELEVLGRAAEGLPRGSTRAVVDAVSSLVDDGATLIVGPSISDNAVAARDALEHLHVPAINYSGGALTRSHWMFQYQVGALEREPALLVDVLVGRGLGRTALVVDDSVVGREYERWFHRGRLLRPVEVTGTLTVDPAGEVTAHELERLRADGPDALVYLGLGLSARSLARALGTCGWDVPVVANSALMFGYAMRDWRADWDGWWYVDTVADDNPVRSALARTHGRSARGPIGVAAYDIGRLVALAAVLAEPASPAGLREALERIPPVPAAAGRAGTTMSFGPWEHGALEGPFLVVREWRDGRTVQVERP